MFILFILNKKGLIMTKKIKNTFLITSFLFISISALANSDSEYLPKEKKDTQFLISVSDTFNENDNIIISKAIENIKNYNQHSKILTTNAAEKIINENSIYKIIYLEEGKNCISNQQTLNNQILITINKEYCLTPEIITQILSNIF